MKAILVIELPENLNKAIDEIRVDIKANLYGNELLDWRNQVLKPMPQKKDISFNELHFEEWYIKKGCTHGWKDFVKEKITEYNMGYNNCIDELLGEERDR